MPLRQRKMTIVDNARRAKNRGAFAQPGFSSLKKLECRLSYAPFPDAERCQSGRLSSTGNAVYRKVTRVRIPASPPAPFPPPPAKGGGFFVFPAQARMEGSLFQESGCRRDTEGTEGGNTEGTETPGKPGAGRPRRVWAMPAWTRLGYLCVLLLLNLIPKI